MPLFDWSDKPVTKKDLLMALGTVALGIWLSDSDDAQDGIKKLRQGLGGLIAGNQEEPKKEIEAPK